MKSFPRITAVPIMKRWGCPTFCQNMKTDRLSGSMIICNVAAALARACEQATSKEAGLQGGGTVVFRPGQGLLLLRAVGPWAGHWQPVCAISSFT